MKFQEFIIGILCLMFSIKSADCQKLTLGGSKATTYAVVVGISDYRDDAIPDLSYAHKDAEAFIQFLQSEAGGALAEDQMKILINQEATTARIAAAMDWLIEVCQDGDEAIIYFSGHGDVETKTNMQHGFLLTYDSPPNTYIAGAYPLFYLQSIISTLSSKDKVKVTMFMDACHAGKLAGSSIGGTEATSSVLAKQFANETKILSCQPNEFSLEGSQWGGGRGVFSFHLIDGLKGLADKDGDFQIKLLELERYLEDKVSIEVSPASQIPMTVGIKSNVIAYVDETTLIKLKAQKGEELPMIAMVDSRGLEEGVLSALDSIKTNKYKSFLKALCTKPLMASADSIKDNNAFILTANDLYNELLLMDEFKPLFNHMRRSLAVALQEEAQIAINDFLKIRAGRVSTDGFDDKLLVEEYFLFARYLIRAAELLGSGHYMYDDLISKKLYFEGQAFFHSSVYQANKRDSLLNVALAKYSEAVDLSPNAPFIYYELALVYSELKNFTKAVVHAEKACGLSPQWPLPYHLLSNVFFRDFKWDKSIEYASKALDLQPDFEDAFFVLSKSFYETERFDELISVSKSIIETKPTYLAAYLEMSAAYVAIDQLDKGIDILQKANRLMPKNALVHTYLGELYYGDEKYTQGSLHIDTAITIEPYNTFPYHVKAMMYIYTDQLSSSKVVYENIIKRDPSDYIALGMIGSLLMQQKRYDEAFEWFEKSLAFDPFDPASLFNMGSYFYIKGEMDLAFEWFEKAFQHDFIHLIENFDITYTDCFKEIRENENFKSLIKAAKQ